MINDRAKEAIEGIAEIAGKSEMTQKKLMHLLHMQVWNPLLVVTANRSL